MRIIRSIFVITSNLMLLGCSPETNVKFVSYRLIFSVENDQGPQKFSVVNRVRLGKRYEYAPGMSGTVTTCKAHATAIIIPVQLGLIIALPDTVPHSSRDLQSCRLAEHWLGTTIHESQRPRLVFVKKGASISNSIAVNWDELKDFGAVNPHYEAFETEDESSSIPKIFQEWGCSGKLKQNSYTKEIPDCSSLVVRDLD